MSTKPIKTLMILEWIIFIFLCIGSIFFMPKDSAVTIVLLILFCAISTTIIYFDMKNEKSDLS